MPTPSDGLVESLLNLLTAARRYENKDAFDRPSDATAKFRNSVEIKNDVGRFLAGLNLFLEKVEKCSVIAPKTCSGTSERDFFRTAKHQIRRGDTAPY